MGESSIGDLCVGFINVGWLAASTSSIGLLITWPLFATRGQVEIVTRFQVCDILCLMTMWPLTGYPTWCMFDEGDWVDAVVYIICISVTTGIWWWISAARLSHLGITAWRERALIEIWVLPAAHVGPLFIVISLITVMDEPAIWDRLKEVMTICALLVSAVGAAIVTRVIVNRRPSYAKSFSDGTADGI